MERTAGGQGADAASRVALVSTPYQIDLCELPFLWVRFPARTTLEEIDLHVENLFRIFEQLGPYALLADIDDVEPLRVTAMHRARIAEGADKLAEAGAILAEGIVVSSTIMRGMVTAYWWCREKRPYPAASFDSRADAAQWAERLRAQSWPRTSGSWSGERR